MLRIDESSAADLRPVSNDLLVVKLMGSKISNMMVDGWKRLRLIENFVREPYEHLNNLVHAIEAAYLRKSKRLRN